MTDWLIKIVVKDAEQTELPEVRTRYGKFAGAAGIICNLFLFAGKLTAGWITGSVAVQADAANNLSDASSSIVSLLGFRLAEKPADTEHPYGHARYEYLAGLFVSVLILLIGFELFKDSFQKIWNPTEVSFNWGAMVILVCSILVKGWLMLFNRRLGKLIHSETLMAAAADSRNDMMTTTAVLAASMISHYTGLELDGFAGVLMAVFILYSGVILIKDTMDPLLGKAPDPNLVLAIQKKILSYPGVLGTHDLLLHDYGPGRQFGSVHVEMAAEKDVLECHEIIDTIERDFLEYDRIHMIVHYDPIVTEGDETVNFHRWLSEHVKQIHPLLTVHDLRIVPGKERTNVIFDCVIPLGSGLQPEDVRRKVKEIVGEAYPNYVCVITMDESYAALPHE